MSIFHFFVRCVIVTICVIIVMFIFIPRSIRFEYSFDRINEITIQRIR